MTEIAFALDFIDTPTDRRPRPVAPTRLPGAHLPIPALDYAPPSPRTSGFRAVVESAVGTAFSATVAVAMLTGLAGAGAASAVAGAATALRAR
ncbi:hypothetical protein [Rhodococcus sp. O3]|uniref:hypothetical protein n=1 Tax=Rhodococcus sp. O3 TaxID=3404919 RepID=UPI003B67A362